jgi:hypothetical protein
MKYRKMRIAWSVAWGVVAVLLCVLWVRSYWRLDRWGANRGNCFVHCHIFRGEFRYLRASGGGSSVGSWHAFNKPVSGYYLHKNENRQEQEHRALGFGGNVFGNGWEVAVPMWFPFLIATTFGGAIWIPWSRRFSLCTLLVATTVVAVVLGLVVWAAQ